MAKAAVKTAKTVKKEVQETNILRRVTARAKNTNIGVFNAGDTVTVFVKVKEGEKERIQLYKGIVIRVQGSGTSKSFTVRKISAGVGVERTFPFASPAIEKVEVLNHGKVRRSRLYYLRGLDGKAAKIESELVTQSKTPKAAAAETTEA